MAPQREKGPASPTAHQIGIAIRTRREKVGWSQEQLGFAANTHRTYIGEIERGKKAITVDKLVQLANALNCSASQILKDSGL